MTLRRAVLTIVALAVTVALVPVGFVVLDQVEAELDRGMRADLVAAPRILGDRWQSLATVRMMHARDLAGAEGLATAVAEADTAAAMRILADAFDGLPERPLLVDASGGHLAGATEAPAELLDSTRAGAMPVSVVGSPATLHLLALAPIRIEGRWIGAAGGSTPLDDEEAQALAGLTRTEVVVIGPDGGLSGSSLAPAEAAEAAPMLYELMASDTVAPVTGAGRDWFTTSGALPGGASVFFLRDRQEALRVVPAIRRSMVVATGAGLMVALVLGGLLSLGVTRPVDSLAEAADRFRAGDVEAPVPHSRLTDVERLSEAFREMRIRLAARLTELEEVNRELADRQDRLTSLQAELVQRERRLATGHLVSQLAHEIRNPVASIRNCLEVILREVRGEDRAEEFTRMAIEELLRLHELTEQMLSVEAPDTESHPASHPKGVAQDVARLVSVGDAGSQVRVHGDEGIRAGLPQEGLKQVLLNLMLNAGEASGGGPVEVRVDRLDDGRVTVAVEDRGDGIPDELLKRIFDPFFTTKSDVHGVGLGLFMAEAIVRRYGGAIRAENRADGPGARFVVTLPPTDREAE